jgi:hypothetical protein
MLFTTSSNSGTTSGISGTVVMIFIVVVFLILISLLVIVTRWARRRHELARFKAEQAEADRKAEKEVQQLQYSWATANLQPRSPANTLCPNCGDTVHVGATYCPNCRYQLSPLVKSALSTLNISPVPAVPIIDQGFAPSATTEQLPVKEAAWDDHAIQATLKRLWDKAS